MINQPMPLLIPLLAAVYVLTIYLLLVVAQRSTKFSRLRLWRVDPAESRSSVR